MRGESTTFRPGTTQTVTISGTSAAVSNAFGSSTHTIRIVSTTNCHYTLAGTPTATTSHPYLPAGAIEYIDVSPGEKIAFIQNAAGGTAYVTEVSK